MKINWNFQSVGEGRREDGINTPYSMVLQIIRAGIL